MVLLVAALSVVAFLAQRQAGATGTSLSASARHNVANALVAYGRYVKKLFWPNPLAIPYPLPSHWPTWIVAGSALGLLAISVLTLVQFRRRPWLAVGWFWFVGMLVPVIGLVQIGHQSMADRYTYLPVVGLFIMVVWSLPEKMARSNRETGQKRGQDPL